MANTNMTLAKRAKNDEFYTMREDINKEVEEYKKQLEGKIVYCNCDDAKESNFFKYLADNFEYFGLKKLITTGYKVDGKGVVLIYEGDKNGNRKVEESEIITRELEGNGDFRSEECIEFLKEADIVITNPPFSLFREYIAQLMEYDKKFLIIGNSNAISYKETFSLIKSGKVWLGNNWVKEFTQPNGEIKKFGNICWFTNLKTNKEENLSTLTKVYSEELYPKYDNYDAINVDKVNEIPYDYEGVMGVPITIVDKVCSDGLIHFNYSAEIGNETGLNKYSLIGAMTTTKIEGDNYGYPYINGKKKFARVLIKKVK